MNKQDKLALDSIGNVLNLQLLAIESTLKAYDQITGSDKKDEIEIMISKFNISIRNIVNKMNKVRLFGFIFFSNVTSPLSFFKD